MKINTLRIEPHRVMPDTTRESYGAKEGTILWRIWVDDKLIANNVYPFTKTNSSIDMSIDPNFPFWGDSNYYTQVRFLENLIIWTDLEIDGFFYAMRFNATFFVFDLETYSEICDTAIAQTDIAELRIVDDRTRESFQRIDTNEIIVLLQAFFPKHLDEIVIYRQPHDRYDTTGIMISRRIQKAIAETKTVKLCDTPTKTVELRIGLDMPEFCEAIWHLGRCAEGFALYFEELPYFPAWLYSESLSKALEQEDFAKEL